MSLKLHPQPTLTGYQKTMWINCILDLIEGALDKYSILPQLFPKKVGIFTPLEVMAWVKTACRVLLSRLIYFWNLNMFSIFYFSKSTSINAQHSSLWDTLKMMLFTKYLIKWKRIVRISWKFWYWFKLKFSIEIGIKRKMLYLSNAPLNDAVIPNFVLTKLVGR